MSSRFMLNAVRFRVSVKTARRRRNGLRRNGLRRNGLRRNGLRHNGALLSAKGLR